MDLTPTAREVLYSRYLLRDAEGIVVETPEEMFSRVAVAVASVETTKEARERWGGKFYDIMSHLLFLPNSPCLMNAGTPLGQLSACFVLPIEDSMEGIFKTLYDMAMIQRTGGGTGFSFSHLRPRGDIVLGTRGVASGPVSFLRMYDAATNEIKQGGKRRGANMATLRVDHPDIMEFIGCKDAENTHITNFNISVWMDTAFMDYATDRNSPFVYTLINPRTNEHILIDGHRLVEAIVEQAWKTGDPGLLFGDRINTDNPTPWLGPLEAVNPCGEQPLLPYEACVLGSINLARVDLTSRNLDEIVRTAVRFLDNCIDVQTYTLPAIERLHRLNRKIGLGVMGWADWLAIHHIPYTHDHAASCAESMMSQISTAAHTASIELAEERGAFPGQPAIDIPQRRNATVTTIAPTGSIGLIAGCSSGIEPYFALAVRRENVLEGKTLFDVNPHLLPYLQLLEHPDRDGVSGDPDAVMNYVKEHGTLPDEAWAGEWIKPARDIFVTAHQIPYQQHVRMQAAFQRYTDNAVSKTINLPHEATREDVYNAFIAAYQEGCKGVTVFRDGCKWTQVLHAGEGTSPATSDEKPIRVVAPRPAVMSGHTEKIRTGVGSLYLTINYNGVPREVFAQIGKAGSEVAAFTEALARLVSLALRSDIPVEEVANQLVGIGGAHPSGLGPAKVLSVPDAIGRALVHTAVHLPEGKATPIYGDICPQCGNASLRHQEGCVSCGSCGYTTC